MEESDPKFPIFKAIEVQCLYAMRGYCHVRDEFWEKLASNIKDLGLPEEVENMALARVIVSWGNKFEVRNKFLNEVINIIGHTLGIKDEDGQINRSKS